MPVAPGLGRYFLPLNRGKRSVVLDLKTEEAGARVRGSRRPPTCVLHNYPPERAESFGLDWPSLHDRSPKTVVGVVTSFGSRGPLAAAPAYDLVAQAQVRAPHVARVAGRSRSRAGGEASPWPI